MNGGMSAFEKSFPFKEIFRNKGEKSKQLKSETEIQAKIFSLKKCTRKILAKKPPPFFNYKLRLLLITRTTVEVKDDS